MRFKDLSIIEKYDYIEKVTSGAIEPDVTDTVKHLNGYIKNTCEYSTRTTQGEICYE